MFAEHHSPHSKTSDYAWQNARDSIDARESNSSATPGQALHCANCDIEILWSPTIVQGKTFCCTGCAAGGPCNCDYSQYRSVNIAGIIHYVPEKVSDQN